MTAQCEPQDNRSQPATGGGILAVLARGLAFSAASFVALMKTVTRDGTVAAIGREAIKDVRNTIHAVFFGRGEGQAEPGTPLNPPREKLHQI